MAEHFRTAKRTDRQVLGALGQIAEQLAGICKTKTILASPHLGEADLAAVKPSVKTQIESALDLESQVFPVFYLKEDSTGQSLLRIQRQPSERTDAIDILDFQSQASRFDVHVRLVASVRRYLGVDELEGLAKELDQSAWGKYSDSQAQILAGLQETTKSLLEEVARRALAQDEQRAKKFQELEVALRAEASTERQQLQEEARRRSDELDGRARELAAKEAAFNTREARYVARQAQAGQLTQIHEWVKDWNLTAPTRKKRYPIWVLYALAIGFLGWLSFFTTLRNYELMSTVDEITKLTWWQWTLVTLRSVLPLAGFFAFLAYFIKWLSSWARQHAEDEIRNRTLLVDLGRSIWLLEAVRDAQDTSKEIPATFLAQLSNNLFAGQRSGEAPVEPKVLSDVLLKGLTSLRVKTPDLEVEASKGKGGLK